MRLLQIENFSYDPCIVFVDFGHTQSLGLQLQKKIFSRINVPFRTFTYLLVFQNQSMRQESSIIMKEKTVANEPQARYKSNITSVQTQFRKNVPKEEKEREKKLLQETENLLKNTKTTKLFNKLLVSSIICLK